MELMANTPVHSANRTNPPNPSPTIIAIWQQNVNKSGTCQHDLISSAALARQGIDVVALQEPAINAFGTTIASRDWIPVYPSTHGKDPEKTRSLFLIRSNILTEQWKQIDFPSGDVTVIQLSGRWGTMYLVNIYNDCEKNDTIRLLEAFTQSNLNPLNEHTDGNEPNTKALIWLGDFNRHYPHWDNPSDTRLFTRAALNDAETLISAVAEAGLDLALPPGIPTHLHNVTKRWTRLDHVFISEDALDAVITCDTLPDTPGINTDHLPILTTLDFALARAPTSFPKNFRNVDWEDFVKELTGKLDLLGPPSSIRDQSELDQACSKLTKAIQDIINSKVPTLEIGIKAKKWWTKELKKLRQEANRKGQKASKYKDWPEHHSHAERREANRAFQKTLEHTKRQHWRDWLEKAEDPDIWTAHK
jgi:exonuclease III